MRRDNRLLWIFFSVICLIHSQSRTGARPTPQEHPLLQTISNQEFDYLSRSAAIDVALNDEELRQKVAPTLLTRIADASDEHRFRIRCLDAYYQSTPEDLRDHARLLLIARHSTQDEELAFRILSNLDSQIQNFSTHFALIFEILSDTSRSPRILQSALTLLQSIRELGEAQQNTLRTGALGIELPEAMRIRFLKILTDIENPTLTQEILNAAASDQTSPDLRAALLALLNKPSQLPNLDTRPVIQMVMGDNRLSQNDRASLLELALRFKKNHKTNNSDPVLRALIFSERVPIVLKQMAIQAVPRLTRPERDLESLIKLAVNSPAEAVALSNWALTSLTDIEFSNSLIVKTLWLLDPQSAKERVERLLQAIEPAMDDKELLSELRRLAEDPNLPNEQARNFCILYCLQTELNKVRTEAFTSDSDLQSEIIKTESIRAWIEGLSLPEATQDAFLDRVTKTYSLLLAETRSTPTRHFQYWLTTSGILKKPSTLGLISLLSLALGLNGSLLLLKTTQPNFHLKILTRLQANAIIRILLHLICAPPLRRFSFHSLRQQRPEKTELIPSAFLSQPPLQIPFYSDGAFYERITPDFLNKTFKIASAPVVILGLPDQGVQLLMAALYHHLHSQSETFFDATLIPVWVNEPFEQSKSDLRAHIDREIGQAMGLSDNVAALLPEIRRQGFRPILLADAQAWQRETLESFLLVAKGIEGQPLIIASNEAPSRDSELITIQTGNLAPEHYQGVLRHLLPEEDFSHSTESETRVTDCLKRLPMMTGRRRLPLGMIQAFLRLSLVAPEDALKSDSFHALVIAIVEKEWRQHHQEKESQAARDTLFRTAWNQLSPTKRPKSQEPQDAELLEPWLKSGSILHSEDKPGTSWLFTAPAIQRALAAEHVVRSILSDSKSSRTKIAALPPLDLELTCAVIEAIVYLEFSRETIDSAERRTLADLLQRITTTNQPSLTGLPLRLRAGYAIPQLKASEPDNRVARIERLTDLANQDESICQEILAFVTDESLDADLRYSALDALSDVATLPERIASVLVDLTKDQKALFFMRTKAAKILAKHPKLADSTLSDSSFLNSILAAG